MADEAPTGKALTIDTVLGQAKNQDQTDPLMLTTVTGTEGISQCFVYDVSMARHPDLRDVVPQDLIGTMARIGIQQTGSTFYIYRTGIIQNFQKTGVYTGADGMVAASTHLLQYRARIVPAFQMLAQENRFRIFEKCDVMQIIKKICDEINKKFTTFTYNIDHINTSFPTMEYCVQFGESTYAFLMRLMDRFGIWFTFDHDSKNPQGIPIPDGDRTVFLQSENETMFFGKTPSVPDKQCDIHSMVLTDHDPKDNLPRDVIASFQRQTTAKIEKIWAGNFNILNPTQPIFAQKEIAPSHDVLIESDREALARFQETEEFPGRFQNDAFEEEVRKPLLKQGDDNANFYVDVAENQQEEEVFSISGATKNASIFAGRRIDIYAQHKNFTGDEGNYIAKYLTFSAYEHSYLTTSKQDVFNFIFRDFLFSWLQPSVDKADLTMAIANAGLNNYFQNQQALMWSKMIYGDDHLPGMSWFLPFTLGGITQVGITTALSALETDVEKVLDANAGDYSNTFVAIPQGGANEIFRVPSPEPGARPIAHGPHSAVVIGPDGTDTKKGDIYADALGRVRIRFPWDPGPPKSGQNLPPTWTDKSPGKPYETGDNTCWVRVTEEWAGRHYGTQFLPRIGQEVLVSFMDGDPERPVITGRLYNADHSTTNIPFPDPEKQTSSINALADLFFTSSSHLPLSGIKTWSIPTTKADGSPEPTRFNLLRFDDTRDKEQYLIRSQRRLDITAFEKRYESIGSDRHLTVGKVGKDVSNSSAKGGGGDKGGSYLAKVVDDYHLSVGKARNTLVKKDDSLQVNGSSSERVGGNWSVTVGAPAVDPDAPPAPPPIAAQATIDVPGPLGTIVLNSGFNISLSVGASSIVITPVAISITAAAISLNGPVLNPSPMMAPGAVPLLPTPPIDAGAVKPKEPTLADTGDKLTPPPEPS